MGNNCSVWANKTKTKEEKIWLMAGEIGVTGIGPDVAYVQKIKELETRDKACKGQKENHSGEK